MHGLPTPEPAPSRNRAGLGAPLNVMLVALVLLFIHMCPTPAAGQEVKFGIEEGKRTLEIATEHLDLDALDYLKIDEENVTAGRVKDGRVLSYYSGDGMNKCRAVASSWVVILPQIEEQSAILGCPAHQVNVIQHGDGRFTVIQYEKRRGRVAFRRTFTP